ncbi:hypothetical protein HMPREF0682_1821 [Propionibacterium acidifaciens F0233]|uniref:Antitoxin VbhA domain-containing protein n=2 Tax=Propionibacterium acidifaciens TaxID=556499 RepID=U2QDR5_9ACTN|nr:hypothetical protein HMPREF0682_1821 [Propionibacterium acidifaciens F0233]
MMTATVKTTAELIREERAWNVAQARHSVEMEGLSVTPAGLQDAQEYIDGHIDSDELVARARARYGLDKQS